MQSLPILLGSELQDWNVDVTAAESNLQQVVGVFNFLLRLDLVQPITVYRMPRPLLLLV